LTYLGCPIGHARKRKSHFSDIMKKVQSKIQAWKGKLLSFGGKSVLINNVLQSIPIYLLSAITPPKCVIHDLHKLFAKFLWNSKEEGRTKHWISWSDICRPKKEGGLGFRSLFDVSKAMFAKLWWTFRTKKSMWTIYMWNKYCKRHRPQLVEWNGGSQTWKFMLEARDCIDQQIWWEPKCGHSSVWFDNWTQLGALYYYLPVSHSNNFDFDEVNQLMIQGHWNEDLMLQLLPEDVCKHVQNVIGVVEDTEEWDSPRWMCTSSGKITVGSAWKVLR